MPGFVIGMVDMELRGRCPSIHGLNELPEAEKGVDRIVGFYPARVGAMSEMAIYQQLSFPNW
jgi:hypothetical protein